jgi:hypothetical protein
MHLKTGVISIENKEYRGGHRPRRRFFKIKIRTEGALEGCPSHAPLSSAKKGKKLCLYTVQFFPYSLLHIPTHVGV